MAGAISARSKARVPTCGHVTSALILASFVTHSEPSHCYRYPSVTVCLSLPNLKIANSNRQVQFVPKGAGAYITMDKEGLVRYFRDADATLRDATIILDVRAEVSHVACATESWRQQRRRRHNIYTSDTFHV